MKNIRPIAMYLPQFHPIPENDEWWGKGFTEWTNVIKGKPLFKGHYQPHLPADLGFYDLRLEETRMAQAQLAKEYGIYGFCYYHYWFTGKRVLERPFNEVLESGSPDFPFMLCWANENWTRVWDGQEKNILLEQKYSDQDDIDHIRALMPAFKDSRYIKVEGKAVFAIYRSTRVPDIKSTIQRWRNEAAKEGVQLYLCRIESFAEAGETYLESGFDAAIGFAPLSSKLSLYVKYKQWKHIKDKLSRWYIKYKFSSNKNRQVLLECVGKEIINYQDFVDFVKTVPSPAYKCFPSVSPMWDNSARRANEYIVFDHSTPQKFEEWLKDEIDKFNPFSKEENFIFINAWNEWAEGNHLEPCQRWGRAYLEAVKKVIYE